jgi:NarL family two-component system response regulator YdfI
MGTRVGPLIAVMIASDHPIMRDGLRLRIQQEADMRVVCESTDATRVLRDFRRCGPDVVVIDLHVSHDAGVRAMSSIRRVAPQILLVVLADYREDVADSSRKDGGSVVVVSRVRITDQVIPAIRQAIATAEGGE